MRILVACLMPVALGAQINILTNRYDNPRTGANLSETTLTTANVNVSQFGKVGSFAVDGAVYAQPLYVSGINVGGRVRNVLYVATMNDKVYAFDADQPSSAPLWSRVFTNPPSVTPVPITDIAPANLNIVGNVGIQSTPVIDAASGTIYLVARTKESGSYVQRLHALDIRTGLSRPGSPVTIAGSVPGNAPDATIKSGQKVITFDPKVHVQRAGLALVNGVVLVSWAAHEDITPSHGWIIGFDAASLARTGIMAVSPDVYGGGIWQGGRAPTIDPEGNVYFATGNGIWDGTRNFGDSLLKLRVTRTEMKVLDYFTPSNEVQLNLDDDDLSGSGFTLLPGTRLLLGGGKEGVLYLLNADNLGHKAADDTQIVQKIPVKGGHVMGGPVFWRSSALGPLVYNWSEEDYLTAYRLSGGRLTTPYETGVVKSPGHPGGSLTVSANGSASASGIVWASMPTIEDAIHGRHAGILRAFNAETLAQIWHSDQKVSRDRLGTLMKFVPPVVANGLVYLPNQDNAVAVYGLLNKDFTIAASPASRTIAPGSSATFSVTVAPVRGFTARVDLTASGYPAGASVSFSPAFVSGSGTATMTVSVAAGAAATTFSPVVTGTSGALAHTAAPVSVTVSGAPAATTGIIGIDFVGTGTSAMAASESAGAVPASHWNSAPGAVGSTPLALLNASGVASGATVTWSSNNTWNTPVTEAAGNARMMRGYLDTTNTSSTTVSVSGLASHAYDVYVYVDGANGSSTRAADYRLSGAGFTATTVNATDQANTNFATAFVAANDSPGNYIKFRISGTGFTLSATPTASTNSSRRAPVNGIEIVPVEPPPAPRSVGVDFVGSSTQTMTATEIAGVVAASHWNVASGATRSTPLALVDDSGAASSARLTWAASGTWLTPVSDAPGNRRMMAGYLDTTSTSTTTVTVSNLAAGAYDVYVYVDGDNRSFVRTAAYTVSGAGAATTVKLIDAANSNFGSTFTAADDSAGNYVKFRIDGTGFTISAAPLGGTNATWRAPVNGLQIVPVTGP